MPDIQDAELLQRKSHLRARMTEQRIAQGDPHLAGEAAARNILSYIHFSSEDVLSAYVAMRAEIDPAPLLGGLSQQGVKLALPVVERRAAPLRFRSWSLGEPLVPGGFQTRVPAPENPWIVPNLLIVPLLAFDRRGFRLGYGGGFYDRTLADLRRNGSVYAIGLAYAFQEVETVPVSDTDQRLDAIATENELIAIAERAS